MFTIFMEECVFVSIIKFHFFVAIKFEIVSSF